MIRRSTWILLGLFLIFALATLLWQQYKVRQEAQATPTSSPIKLFETEGKEITGIRISSINDGLIEANQDPEGNWTLENLPGESVDTPRIESAINTIIGMSILSQVDTPPELSVIGLEPAESRVSITLEDGTVQKILIGVKTPTQSGYYSKTEAGSVVVVSSLNIENLLELLTDRPIIKTPTQSPTSEILETP